METNELVTPREVDLLLRYPRGRALRLARASKLPYVRLPDGEIRFRAQDIQQLLEPQPHGGACV